MAMEAYRILLALWVPSLIPAFASPHPARTLARGTVACGLAAALWELWVYSIDPAANIRVDILRLFWMLIVLYVATGVHLYRAGWRVMAALVLGLVALAAAMMVVAAMRLSAFA